MIPVTEHKTSKTCVAIVVFRQQAYKYLEFWINVCLNQYSKGIETFIWNEYMSHKEQIERNNCSEMDTCKG